LEKFPPQVAIHDSITKDRVIEKHDTIIKFIIVKEVKHDSIPVNVYIDKQGKPQALNTPVITKETQFAMASAYVKNGVLYLDVEQKNDSIQATIKNAIQKETLTQKEVKSKESTVVIKEHWKPDVWSLLIGCVLMLAALYGIAKFKK
jgi:hypothetical protein